MGMVRGIAPVDNAWWFLKKIKNTIAVWPSSSTSGCIPQITESGISKGCLYPRSQQALLTIARMRWLQRCASRGRLSAPQGFRPWFLPGALLFAVSCLSLQFVLSLSLWVRECSNFICPHVAAQSSLHHWWKRLSFLPCMFSCPLLWITWLEACGFISGLAVLSIDPCLSPGVYFTLTAYFV